MIRQQTRFLVSKTTFGSIMAYMGIPFTDNVTVEIGRYRSTYGPLGATYNFAYDDVSSSRCKRYH